MTMVSSGVFAQSSRTDINSALSTWIWPVVGFGFLCCFARLVWVNWDAIQGKGGLQKQDGWLAVGEGLIYVLVICTALGFVAGKVAAMNYSI